MKLSRREMAALAAGSALAVKSSAQTPPAANADTAQAVREGNRRNSELLAKFDVPAATEPAFQFRA
ncbi:MAG: hypothetical protein ABUS49_10585 [Acidobacteriota bacterium]